jgi:ribosomal protein L11 methyltransferase
VRYIEIIAAVPSVDAPRAADVMHGLFESGLWIESPFEQPDLEEDAQTLKTGTSHIHAYVVADNDEAGIVLRLREQFAEAALEADIEMRLVADEDWAEAWKEHFHVERYGQRIVVVPSWRTHNALPGDIILTLDPGMAFGTGQHETTRMCLEAIERTVKPGMRVLDVGCGSGILAIAAAKLGAVNVAAIDIDPVCVKVAASNNSINKTEVAVAEGTMGALWPFAVAATGRYDIVVANIIARAIVGMANDLAAALATGGRLIVSGVIGERETEVVSALCDARLSVDGVRAMGEWRCIEATKPS